MAEAIIDARGAGYGLVVNQDGSINVSGIGVDITIGSLALSLESIYVASGDNLNLGSAWQGTGSVHLINPIGISGTITSTAGSESYNYGLSGANWNELRTSDEGWLYTRSFKPEINTGSIGAIIANTETLIAEHDITVGSVYYLTGFDATASADTMFKLYHNGVLQTVLKINPAQRNIEKTYPFPLRFATGSIGITGKHQDSDSQGFAATLYGEELGL